VCRSLIIEFRLFLTFAADLRYVSDAVTFDNHQIESDIGLVYRSLIIELSLCLTFVYKSIIIEFRFFSTRVWVSYDGFDSCVGLLS